MTPAEAQAHARALELRNRAEASQYTADCHTLAGRDRQARQAERRANRNRAAAAAIEATIPEFDARAAAAAARYHAIREAPHA